MKRKYIMASFSIIFSIIISIYLLVGTINLKILFPSKTILFSVIIFITIIFNIIAYFSRNYKIYNTGVFISFILNITLIYILCSFNYNYNFLQESLNQKYQYVTYNIYVQKTNPKYSSIDKLSGKNIGLLNENKVNIKDHLNKKANLQYKTYDTLKELETAIESGEIQGFIIKEKSSEIEESDIKKKLRIICTEKIKSKNSV